MEDTRVEDFLQHFGVKGMKWGVRKDKVIGQDVGVDYTKGDLKWREKSVSVKNYVKINNKMAEGVNRDLDALNKKYANKTLDFNERTGTYTNADGKRYLKEYESMVTGHAVKAAREVLGDSPSGNWAATASYNIDRGLEINILPKKDLEHGGLKEIEGGLLLTLDVKVDSSGFFQPIPMKDEIEHSDISQDFIAHYGVKGMKWGVRRRSGSRPSSPSKKSLARKAKDLDDADLKKAVERLRLEKEYVTISQSLDASGTAKTKAFLSKHSGQAASIAVGSATSAVVGAVIKKKMNSN